MASALAQQLAAVQSEPRSRRGRASFLFDEKVAEKYGSEEVFALGTEGLSELCALDRRFRPFEGTLFSSKDFDRELQTRETNARVDDSLAGFLKLLSPFFLLRSAHKVLEFLVWRFR
jgi:U3 small nucleolar RNA-associated protein 10